MTSNDDSWSGSEEETTAQEPTQSTNAEIAAPGINVNEDEGDADAWCEVSHNKRKQKKGDSGANMEAGKGVMRSPEGGYKGGYKGGDSPTKKGKGHGKKGDKSPSTFAKESPLREANSTPSMSPMAKAEGKPLPPWRRQNPSPVASPTVPTADPTEGPHPHVVSPLKSGGYGPRSSPKSPAYSSPIFGAKVDQEAKELANDRDRELDLPPTFVSFRSLHKDKDSSPTKEPYRAHKGDRGDDHASPEKNDSPAKDPSDEKEEGKRRVRDDVHEEVNALVDSSDFLQRSDFDGKARQFLHAIHNLAGRQGVHDALHVIEFSTNKKSRDSIRNVNGYVSTLLQKFFQETLGGGKKSSKPVDKEEKGEEKKEAEDKEQKEKEKDLTKSPLGPPAALAGSLTAAPFVLGPSRARAKAVA